MRRRRREARTCATCAWYRPGRELASEGRVRHECAVEGEGRDATLWMPPDGGCVMWDERGDDERLAR